AAEKTGAERFLRVLNGLQDERLPFLVAMTLRSDYLSELQEAPALTAPFEEFSLKPMPLARVRDIIEGPARVAGLTVDGALVAAAMNDAATDDALPLLAFALRELYDRFGQKRHLTLEAYQALGDDAGQLSPLENAVRRKADEVLAAAKPAAEDLQALKEAFVPAMVRVNSEGEYARRPARFEALPANARPLIERLARARLLIIQKEQEATIVEVAHEALLRKWPLLRGWLDEEREFLIGKDQLEQDLRDWKKTPAAEKSEALLSGLKLTRARTWLVEKPLQLLEAERKFIQASIAHQEAEAARRERLRRRVQQASVSAAVVLAICLAGAMWEWWIAKAREATAESRELAARAEQDVAAGGDLGIALRTAVQAAERSPTDQAEHALRTVLGGPLEHLILHQGGPVYVGAFSPDGKLIVTAGMDHSARVWDAVSGRLLATLSGHSGPVNDAGFSPDGKSVVTASDDGTARVWDAVSGRLPATLSGPNVEVRKATFSPDGKRIVTNGADNAARVWDAETGQLRATLSGHARVVYHAAFSPDGKRIVTASWDESARVWDAETGHLLETLIGHSGALYHAAFSPDGKRIVTASEDGTARVWDAHSGLAMATLSGGIGVVYDAAFSPDGKRVVTAGNDGTARVWDADIGHPLAILSGLGGRVWDASFSPDGKHFVTGGEDNIARVWDGKTGALQATLAGHSLMIYAVAFSPDSKRIVTSSADKTARVWDVETGQLRATLSGATRLVYQAAFSPDG